jgi:L-fuculose-phosphate aldolase
VNRNALEAEVLRICQALDRKGWVANHDGNVTARIGVDRYLATPTAFAKARIERQHLLVVDGDGNRVSGRERPFSELALHLAVYRNRADVGAVVHSHAPHATALAVAGIEIEAQMMAEPVVSLGERIPLVPFALPKSPAATLNLLPFVERFNAVTLENHGVLTWAADLETAFLRMELVEHLARIQLLAPSLRTISLVPD